MRVQDLQIEDKTYKDLFQQQYLADGYNAAQHTLTTPRLASKKMTADKFNGPAADMENLQDDWFVGVVKYVADLVVKFGTNVEYIMQDAGEYSDNTQYHLGQVVTYQGGKWICIVDTQITVPPSISGDTWLQVPNGVDGLSGVDFGVSDLYASSQDWDSTKLYSKNDLVYYAITDISNKPIRTMLFAALRSNSGINPTSAGQTAWLKIFDQPATKIVISENEPVDKYTGQIWGEKSKMPNYYSDGSPYYNLTMHQYNGSSWDDLYPKTTVANVVDGVTDKLIPSLTANSGDVLTYSSSGDTWSGTAPYSQSSADARYLKLSGGTVTGPLQIAKGTATNSAIRLDEIQNGVAPADGSIWVEWYFNGQEGPWAYGASNNETTVVVSTDGFYINVDPSGMIQTNAASIGLDNPRGIAYGGNKFVVIGNNTSTVRYSQDGTTWTSATLPASRNWSDICYGGGKFVVIATDSKYGAYSSDGITWTQMSMSAQLPWSAVTYGGGMFVAVVSQSNISAHSSDGITWVEDRLPDSKDWIDVAYGNNRFVAITKDSDCSVSTDVGTWGDLHKITDSSTGQVFSSSITFGFNKFVCSTPANSGAVMWRSKNGFDWIPEETPLSGSSTISHVTYGLDRFLFFETNPDAISYLVAQTGISTLNGAVPSSDISSTLAKSLDTSAQENQLQSIANAIKNKKGSTATIQASKFATEIRNFPEQPKWQKTPGGSSLSVNYNCCAYGDGKFVALIYNLNYFSYSSDGINWTYTSGLPFNGQWTSIRYGNGKFVAVAEDSGAFVYSSDGVNWTAGDMPTYRFWNSVCYGNGKFVAVATGTQGAYSSDGVIWINSTLPVSSKWISVCYGAGKFVAVSETDNVLAYSLDGVTWSQSSDSTPGVKDVAYGNGKFVAVGEGSSTLMYSNDGITWTKGNLPQSGIRIAYGGNKFVASASTIKDKMFYSLDGITWNTVTLPITTDGNFGLAYGAGKFVCAGFGATQIMYIQDSHTTLG